MVKKRASKYEFLSASAIAALLMSPTLVQAQDVPGQPVAPAVTVDQDAEVPAPPVTQERGTSEGEIIVTARKRSESMLDVPVAISALPQETLIRYNVNELNAITTLVPNVTIVKAASGTGASMTIRGVGSTFNDFGIDQTVAVNIDGIAVSRGFITNVAFFDVAQVEVLKGPQALFFGKNSPAGVISLTSAGPSSSYEYGIKAGYEFVADEGYIEGFASGPITDSFGLRVAARYSKMAGYLYNNAAVGPNPTDPNFALRGGNGRAVSNEAVTGRLTAEWNPTSAFSATLKVLGNSYTDDGMSAISQPVLCAPGNQFPTDVVNGVPIPDTTGDCRADNQVSTGNLPIGIEAGYPGARDGRNYATVDAVLASLTLNYDSGPVSFTSVTGYNHGKFLTLSNYGYTSFNRFPGVVDETNNGFSQEFRVNTDLGGAINFAGGVFYENSKRSGGIKSRFFSPPQDPATGLFTSTIRFHTIDSETISAFGQAIWDITPTLELAGGARFTHETKRTREGNTYVHPNFRASFLAPGLVIENNFKDDNISPEVTLTWKPVRDITLYGAYKTGYKSGGASIPTSITPDATSESLAFGPEQSEGGEIGFKGQLFDRRLTVTADIYRYDLSGLQLVMVETLPNGLFVNLVRNAADARTEGAEVDLNYRATESLTVQGSVAYNNARITRFPNAPCWALQTAATGCVTNADGSRTTDRAGDPLSKAPKLTVSGGFNYSTPVGSSMKFGLSGQGKYVGDYRTQDDGAPYARQEAFVTLDGSVRIGEIDDRWELALIGRNLTNQYYLQVSSPRPGGVPGDVHGVIARPREITLQASFRF